MTGESRCRARFCPSAAQNRRAAAGRWPCPHCWLRICRLAWRRHGGGGVGATAGMETVCIYDAATFPRQQARTCPNSVRSRPTARRSVGARQEGVFTSRDGCAYDAARSRRSSALAFSDGPGLAAGRPDEPMIEADVKDRAHALPGGCRAGFLACCGFGVFRRRWCSVLSPWATCVP